MRTNKEEHIMLLYIYTYNTFILGCPPRDTNQYSDKGTSLYIPKYLDVCTDYDFCDDDIFAENYSGTELGKCSVSEGTLRRILEQETLECRCRIEYCDFELRNDIDVDHLTRALPNPVNTAGSEWKMRSRTGLLRQSSFHTMRILRIVEQSMSELFATRSEQFQAQEQVLAVRPLSSVLSPLFWGGVHDTILSQLI
uniref:Activin_recp domain-containing protein n=1 Tax=Heterorhabditis bacteriophora TaxID=37862 RepID=A0A1I7WAF9_HETBA